MIISHEHRFIYFKSCKTAGTSIEVFLSAYCGQGDVITRIGESTAEWHQARHYRGFRNHDSAAEVRNCMNKKLFDSYYKFTSIRNPLDKMLSLYYWWRDTKYISWSVDFNNWIAKYKFHQWRPVFHYPFYKIGSNIITDDFIRY